MRPLAFYLPPGTNALMVTVHETYIVCTAARMSHIQETIHAQKLVDTEKLLFACVQIHTYTLSGVYHNYNYFFKAALYL